MSRSYLIKRIQRNTISASLILCVAFLSVLAMAWTANAQTATFFAAKDNATEYKVFRYQVTPTTAPVLSATITDSSLIYPLGLTLGQSGELFVVNQGTSGGFVTRFLNPTVTPLLNGIIPAGPEMTFYGAFKGNELFLAQRYSGVLRFLVDPNTGIATPNGQIPITATIGEFRGIVLTPWGELFVSEIGGTLPSIIHRITFDANGNAQSNGVISNPSVGSTHGMVFSPWGELFVTSPSNNSIGRFTFDSANNASFNGSISGGGLNVPLDVSFAPWGELFVGNCLGTGTFSPGVYQGISRFNFDAAHVASSNGTVTTPFPISSITFVPGPYDSTPPTSSLSSDPSSNLAGWTNDNVNVSIDALDNEGGSGVKEITFSASGAEIIPATTVNGASTSVLISAEGETIVSYFAKDIGGNSEVPRTFTVRIDKTSPSFSCGSSDGQWHSNNVLLTCTGSDTVSHLANASDASFSLMTGVGAGTETANAGTTTNAICDNAGNCATAGPITGNKVDRKAPAINITTPTAASYVLNQSVTVNFNCTDGGSGVATCIGTSADGSTLDTWSAGSKTFTVTATDNVGNSASSSVVNYSVAFGLQVLFDQTKAHKSGSTVPIKIRLVDANGVNVSSASTVVHAVSVVQTGSQASTLVEDAGNANPDFDFRYDASLGSYIFNLKTTGYGTGSYVLNFNAGNSSTLYSMGFQVRQ